jgi:hypothetical protein
MIAAVIQSVTIPLANARWCEDCRVIHNCESQCPNCAGQGVECVEPWLERKTERNLVRWEGMR